VTRPFVRLTILLISLLPFAGCDRGDHPHALGRRAPDFTVSDGTRTVHLADYRGKIVLLNFWATWCAPCIAELPSLQAMHQDLPQVVVIAVSVDENPDAYHRFLEQHPLNLLTVEDTERHVNALYGTSLFPESYLIDRNGIIQRKFVNAQDWTNPEILNYISHL
jgi:cytochrome c biogenesis protein CcmG/thiol:disulfide interchange protein DsbE